MLNIMRIALLTCLLFNLTGCGQSGRLYLPKTTPQNTKTTVEDDTDNTVQ